MADLCQGLPQENCTFLAASGWEDTGDPIALPSAAWGRGLAAPARMALLLCRDGQPRIPSSWPVQEAKEGADPAGSGHAPGAGAAAGAGPAQPFLLPLTPHSTAGTPGQYCHSLCQGPHLAPALLQHQCSLCTWLQLCWVASGTPHPALGLGGKYSFLSVSQGCSNASHCSPPTCEAAGGMCPNCDMGH